MSSSLTQAYNATLLLSVPVDINRRPTRRPSVFEHVTCASEQAFCTALEQGGSLTWQRSLQDVELQRLVAASGKGAQIQSPAGIPGFDRVGISGCVLVNLCKATGLLENVRYFFRPPCRGHAGLWMLEFTASHLRLGSTVTPADYERLKARFLPQPEPLAAASPAA